MCSISKVEIRFDSEDSTVASAAAALPILLNVAISLVTAWTTPQPHGEGAEGAREHGQCFAEQSDK